MLGPEKANELFLIWFHGIISQLTNQPVDIMIEKWIFRDHPDLRELQLASFRKQQAQAVYNLKAEVQNSAPPLLHDASNLMFYAYLRQLGLCVGENFLKSYNSSPYIDKGKALSAILDGVKDDSIVGDVLKINRWTEFLGLEGWFDWIDFEKIPPGYEDAV